MNLYIWEGDGVLTDYTDGIIVALANTQEEAEAEILPQVYERSNYPKEPTLVIDLSQNIPPQAWVCWGGS